MVETANKLKMEHKDQDNHRENVFSHQAYRKLDRRDEDQEMKHEEMVGRVKRRIKTVKPGWNTEWEWKINADNHDQYEQNQKQNNE